MVDENSVNAQPTSECAVKKLKGMCAVSFFAGIDAYITCAEWLFTVNCQ